MRLTNQEIKNRAQWEKAGIGVPQFDREAMIAATEKTPEWVHFGAGNIFRAFPAALAQNLLEKGLIKTGIVVAEGYDGEIIDKCFAPFDNLCVMVTLKSDGTTDKKVIASIASAYRIDREISALTGIFTNPSLKMASFTITEKGYGLVGKDGALLSDIAADMKAGPKAPVSYLGKIAALCLQRFVHGSLPLTMVSMDNCSHNGDKLFDAMDAFAKAWVDNGLADKGFLAYVRDKNKLSFPWTMIDKITPRPDDSVRDMLAAAGMQDVQGIVTAKNTYVAPFVNAEEAQYLVVEDVFPNGKLPLEKAGVLFTQREVVDKVEKMKVCTCLNPLHTALAVFGCLLGYTRISEELKNPGLVKLIEGIGYKEGLPVVVDPGILSPEKFINEVIKIRFPNPFMPDTPQRIATDTSQKIPVRYGETIKAYLASKTLNVNDLKLIPLVMAAWIRYLMGIDDSGNAFTPSPDPRLADLAPIVSGIKLGQKGPFAKILEPILKDEKIFGVDLYKAGLAEKVLGLFEELIAGKGAVASVLKKYTGV
ncbi:MAG: mannitol dehydrogenase family protein [Treponema sp.]|nr:mannitol dehydrogenase family protein [Treponema sp.]